MESRTFIRAGLLLASAGACGLALTVACKKKENEVQYPPGGPTSYVGPDAAPPPSASATATAPPAADAGPPEGGVQEGALDMISEQNLKADVTAQAKKDARFMKSASDFFGGRVAEGGQIEQTVQFDSKKCYAVVASSTGGVTELDVQIQAGVPLPLPGPVVAVDSNTGPKASVSPCWKNVFPMSFPAKIVIKATRGAGSVGAQVFVK